TGTDRARTPGGPSAARPSTTTPDGASTTRSPPPSWRPAPPPSRSTVHPATTPAGRITPPWSSATPDLARVLPARRHRAPDATTPRPDLSGRGVGQNRACRCGQRGLARDLRRGRG